MRTIALFRAEPTSRMERDEDAPRTATFVSDPASVMGKGEDWTVYSVRLSKEQMDRLKQKGANEFSVPASVVGKAVPLDRATVEKVAIMQKALEEARSARRSMVLDKVDCVIGGEMASVARLLWRHIPEAASRMGIEVSEDEGGPVLQFLGRDVERAAPVAATVACREDSAFLHRIASGEHPAMGVMMEIASQTKTAAAMQSARQGMAF